MDTPRRFSIITLVLNIFVMVQFAFGMFPANEMSIPYLLLELVIVHGFSELNPILTTRPIQLFFTTARLMMLATISITFIQMGITDKQHVFNMHFYSLVLLFIFTLYGFQRNQSIRSLFHRARLGLPFVLYGAGVAVLGLFSLGIMVGFFGAYKGTFVIQTYSVLLLLHWHYQKRHNLHRFSIYIPPKKQAVFWSQHAVKMDASELVEYVCQYYACNKKKVPLPLLNAFPLHMLIGFVKGLSHNKDHVDFREVLKTHISSMDPRADHTWSLYPDDDSRACALLETMGSFESSEALSLPPL